MCTKLFENDEVEIYKQIYKDYNKSEGDLQEYINIIKKWAETQPHLPEQPSAKLLRFAILYNKFSVEKAKQCLDMYYTIRTLMPEIYNTHPLTPEMIQQSKLTYCVPLAKVSTNSARVIYSQINPNYGPDVFNHEKFLIHVQHVLELLIYEDLSYTFHFIFDCNGLKIGHVPKLSPMVIRKGSLILEKVYSNRVTSIYLVNFHPFMETMLNTVLLPALSPKIRNRVKVHSGCNVLFEVFGKSTLPKDIGGDAPSLEEINETLLKTFEENKEHYNKLRELKVDESRRPEKLVNDEVLGYYGNFKKINVD